jgi:nicotinamidase-related amidase
MAFLNLIIDAHDPQPTPAGIPVREGLDKPMQEKWFTALQSSREELKEEGIPTLFIGIDNYSRLYPANEQRDPDLVGRLHLTRVKPQASDDIFVKRYMDAFTDIDHALADVALRKYLEGQRVDQKKFHEKIINGTLDKNTYFGRPTLDGHFKTLGIDHITVMGERAGFCITDTALSAAMRGIDATVISDRVIGWEHKTYRKAVWHPESPDYHEKEITVALDEVIRNRN